MLNLPQSEDILPNIHPQFPLLQFKITAPVALIATKNSLSPSFVKSPFK